MGMNKIRFREHRVVLAFLLLFTAFAANADDITTIPPDLEPGDQYRLAFITKDKIFTAVSSNIGAYDASVSAQANTSADLVALGTTWRVIGSTSSISAKVHTNTDDSPAGLNGVPIYRLDGVILAENYDDLWDGSIQNPLYVAQDGSVLNTCCGTWTGTSTAGNSIPGNELGAPGGAVVDGAPFGTGGSWVQTSPFGAINQQYLYAISDVLTVPDDVTNVAIDIKPGNDPVCNGVIPIAILGSDTLDVIQIDQTTLSFEGEGVRVGGNGVLSCKIKDANKDGYYDLVCQYDDSTMEGTLNGELLDGTTSIEGADTFCLGN